MVSISEQTDSCQGTCYGVVVVGAGAAGLMAAAHAAEAGARVLLLDSTREGGKKILASGGGRCNILPMESEPRRFVTDSSPNTLRNMLHAFPPAEQRHFFEERLRVPLVLEEESGKYFPISNRARDVRDALRDFAARQGATFLGDARVNAVEPADGEWIVRSNRGTFTTPSLLLATGGLSLPATGSDGFAFETAGRLGLRITDTYPALTPVYDGTRSFAALSGITVHARVTASHGERVAVAAGGFLFTHRGYSGPAVLDVSHVIARAGRENRGSAALRVCWGRLDQAGWDRHLAEDAGRSLLGSMRRALPERLAEALLRHAALDPGLRVSQLTREQRKRAIGMLSNNALPWTDDAGYGAAEVTGGGVHLSELHPKTMECKRHPGLFLAGELLDAFGPIGGHNFQWAWSTGRAAGLGAAHRAFFFSR